MFLRHPYWAGLSIAKHYKSRVERESVGVCVETQGREYSVSEREYSSIMVLATFEMCFKGNLLHKNG